jgi:hypothetical protein
MNFMPFYSIAIGGPHFLTTFKVGDSLYYPLIQFTILTVLATPHLGVIRHNL